MDVNFGQKEETVGVVVYQENNKDIMDGKKSNESPVHNKLISSFETSVKPGCQGWGSSPRQMNPCRSQGGFAIHYANDLSSLAQDQDINSSPVRSLIKVRVLD
ncbi:hypothetical protein PoB_002683800 [Plakobranchus ocellatus]|uniref:Uncharacterized protein n=1 Tax=Plakobranchus ocellatus TaxID=259542 RepID=A0AAV4A0T0_9GAST|nr:hypothetical protein PoB_002683800 [Plakobranchus ocellatus]